MNWLTDYVARRKIQALVARAKREVPENLWEQVPACEQMIFHRELEANLHVCPHCGHHMRVGAGRAAATALFDEALAADRAAEGRRPTRCASATRSATATG